MLIDRAKNKERKYEDQRRKKVNMLNCMQCIQTPNAKLSFYSIYFSQGVKSEQAWLDHVDVQQIFQISTMLCTPLTQ